MRSTLEKVDLIAYIDRVSASQPSLDFYPVGLLPHDMFM